MIFVGFIILIALTTIHGVFIIQAIERLQRKIDKLNKRSNNESEHV